MKIQQCTQCKEQSIPGMTSGHGKCKYHYCVWVWGRKWANSIFPDRAKEYSKAKQVYPVAV